MTKRMKDRQYNDQKKGQIIQWPKEMTDNTMTKRKDRQYNDQKKGQIIQWPKERRTDNTMTKRKDRQYNDQKKEGQTIQWRKERTDNTMTKRKKDRQYNDLKKKEKLTDNDLQNITQKTTARTMRTTLKSGGELRCSGSVSKSVCDWWSMSNTRHCYVQCAYWVKRLETICIYCVILFAYFLYRRLMCR